MPIRRTQGRDGRLYYFNQNGRRIPESKGARQYVRENYSQLSRESLSPREQRSFTASTRARNQYRFEGQFVPNPFNVLSRFVRAANLPQDTRDLTNLFNREQLNRILDNTYTQDITTFRNHVQNIFESYQTRSGDLLDSYSEIRSYMQRGYQFNFVENGQSFSGREALEQLANFENRWQQYYLNERGDLLDNVEFRHRIRLNPRTRMIEIYADETDIIPRGGTP
jgi:hypothetical protein